MALALLIGEMVANVNQSKKAADVKLGMRVVLSMQSESTAMQAERQCVIWGIDVERGDIHART